MLYDGGLPFTMNINELNSFVCNFCQRLSQSATLVMEHADVRPSFSSDFKQYLQNEKCARSQEHCSNFSNQNSRRAAIVRL